MRIVQHKRALCTTLFIFSLSQKYILFLGIYTFIKRQVMELQTKQKEKNKVIFCIGPPHFQKST